MLVSLPGIEPPPACEVDAIVMSYQDDNLAYKFWGTPVPLPFLPFGRGKEVTSSLTPPKTNKPK